MSDDLKKNRKNNAAYDSGDLEDVSFPMVTCGMVSDFGTTKTHIKNPMDLSHSESDGSSRTEEIPGFGKVNRRHKSTIDTYIEVPKKKSKKSLEVVEIIDEMGVSVKRRTEESYSKTNEGLKSDPENKSLIDVVNEAMDTLVECKFHLVHLKKITKHLEKKQVQLELNLKKLQDIATKVKK